MKKIISILILMMSIDVFADCVSFKKSFSDFKKGKIDVKLLAQKLVSEVSDMRLVFDEELSYLDKIAHYEMSLDGTRASKKSWSQVSIKLNSLNKESTCFLKQLDQVLNVSAIKEQKRCVAIHRNEYSKRFNSARKLDRLNSDGIQSEIFNQAFINDLKLFCN